MLVLLFFRLLDYSDLGFRFPVFSEFVGPIGRLERWSRWGEGFPGEASIDRVRERSSLFWECGED
uniref:Uncharacterized protein n=1 Tax=Oryza barthii TaxID=65489 RepID=A0A0D3FMX0_9ORYZ